MTLTTSRAAKFGRGFGISLILAVTLAACTERELILEGDRVPVRDPAPEVGVETPPPLLIPAATANADWTQTGGNALHHLVNPALPTAVNLAWSTDIGSGSSKRARMTSHPVVAGGVVYTLDADATAGATSTQGAPFWRVDLTPDGEGRRGSGGGGVAFFEGALYVTTGYGEVLALNPTNGAILWRTQIGAAISAAPSVGDGTVVAVGRNDIAYGLSTATGELTWRAQGTGLGAGMVGGASPAIRGPLAVIPFNSGEVIGVLLQDGRTIWTAAVTGGRRGLVRARISDISGDPVIDFDTVYVGNQAGRLVALDRRSGNRLWTLQEGAYGPPLSVAGSVFIVSDQGGVLRIDAESGNILWRATLPEWARPDKRRDAIPHFGPLLAGGNLYVASGDGLLRMFDPETGAERGSRAIPGGGAASRPVVAGGVMYLLSQDGRLHAFK